MTIHWLYNNKIIFYNPEFELGRPKPLNLGTTLKTIALHMSPLTGFMVISNPFVCVSLCFCLDGFYQKV